MVEHYLPLLQLGQRLPLGRNGSELRHLGDGGSYESYSLS